MKEKIFSDAYAAAIDKIRKDSRRIGVSAGSCWRSSGL